MSYTATRFGDGINWRSFHENAINDRRLYPPRCLDHVGSDVAPFRHRLDQCFLSNSIS